MLLKTGLFLHWIHETCVTGQNTHLFFGNLLIGNSSGQTVFLTLPHPSFPFSNFLPESYFPTGLHLPVPGDLQWSCCPFQKTLTDWVGVVKWPSWRAAQTGTKGIPVGISSCLACSLNGPTSTAKAREIEGHWEDCVMTISLYNSNCCCWRNLKEMQPCTSHTISGG